METLIWIGILIATGVVLTLAAPYHERLIANRDLPYLDNPSKPK